MAEVSPVILDMGKKNRKQIKKLKTGSGKLMERVKGTLAELHAQNAISEGAQPVIVIVRQKQAKKKGMLAALSGI